MRAALLIALGTLSTGFMTGQQASLNGPVEALTFDAPTRSLRAVLGSPGAASFGPALFDSLDYASVAPRQNYALAFQAGRCLFVSNLGSIPASTRVIPGVSRPEGIVWSGEGSLAILYSRSGNWFQAVSGFPNTPGVGPLVDVSTLGGSLTAIAVDQAGHQIAFAVNGDRSGVYETGDSQSFTPLISMTNAIALSFSNDGQTLFALDGAAPQVTAVSLAGNGFQTLALPGMNDPVAIQSVQDSQNRHLLYVAGNTDRLLRIVDVSSRQVVQDVPLNFEPTSLDPFGNTSFVVAARSQGQSPLWLFASTPQPAAYFVPAIQLRRPDRQRTAITRGSR
jgi:hypothetical protein